MSLVLQSSGGGQITIQEPATASNFTQSLPAATGTIALTSQIPVAGTGPAFAAYPASNTNISSNTNTKVAFNTELYDTANCFDSTTNYRFTPNVAGYYQINFTPNTGASNNNAYWNFHMIYKNGSAYIGQYSVFPAGNIQGYTSQVSQLIYMNGSTDYLEFYVNVYVASGTPSYSGGAGNTLVSGYLARAA